MLEGIGGERGVRTPGTILLVQRVVVAKLPKVDPLGVWTAAKTSLVNQDPEWALLQFSIGAVDHYRKLFSTIDSLKLSQNVGAVGELTPISLMTPKLDTFSPGRLMNNRLLS